MKNTTFRKKALLSSVAMLLVALVALGSATFAWFTADPNVTANGLKMTTSTDAGLVAVSSSEMEVMGVDSVTEVDAKYFDHSVVLNATGSQNSQTQAWTFTPSTTAINLVPVSGVMGSKFKTTAAADNAYQADANKGVETAAATTDYYQETIYFKSSDGKSAIDKVELTDVEINATAGHTTILDALRIEIVYGDNYATYGLDSAGNVYYTDKTHTNKSAAAYTYATTTTWDSQELLATPVNVGSIEAGDSKYLAVIVNVYLDGEDTECYSNNVNLGALVDAIDLSFKADLGE